MKGTIVSASERQVGRDDKNTDTEKEVIIMNKETKKLEKIAFIGLVIIGILAISGCVGDKPAALSDLTKTNELPCTIEWKDNSNNEDGFNIYIGGSCANCEETTDWTKVDSVANDVTSHSWEESCCSVAECSCAMVRAYNENGESPNSNIIMLAPVC
ncbi:MAG TPA: hypothetical protein VMW53_08115 [archaeon]|nr:hypothetical protein [archaeon]